MDCGSAVMGLSSAGRRKSSSTRLPPCAQRATLWEALGTSLSVQGEREKGFKGEEEEENRNKEEGRGEGT